MRLTLNKIEEIIVGILGEEGLPLIRNLYGKENISEFDLAKKTKNDIKVVRKQLYLLYNNNLIGFNRKKDKEKGWYIYYWTILPDSIKFLYYKKKREQLAKLNARLEEEEKELFFECPNHCVRLNFDQGMDFEFHCPECGELILQDNSKDKVELIKKEIKELTDELNKEKKQVEKENSKLRKKIVLAKEKELRKEKKEKKIKKVTKKSTPKKRIKKSVTATKTKKPSVKKKIKPAKNVKSKIKKVKTKKK